MEDKYLVSIDEYKIANSENPILYTRDINSCVALILHRENDCIFMHIEAGIDYIILDDLYDVLGDNSHKINSIDIFIGPNTSAGNISIIGLLCSVLNINYEIYESFKSLSNERSVGYNYNTNDYYMVSMDAGTPIFSKRLKKKI